MANLPAGTLTFAASSVVPAAIGDGVPDVLTTQIASLLPPGLYLLRTVVDG